MPRERKGLLHVGIKGHVLALDLDTGVEVWRTKLEGLRMRSQGFVHLQRDPGAVYASYSGEIFCLDPATGEVRWHNQLTGLGVGLASMLSERGGTSNDDSPSTLFDQERRNQASRQSAATA